ncbi:MAG: SPASM domain-containing protein [Polyangia bacterium]
MRAAGGRSGDRPSSLAVFTAISVETAEALPELAGVVADLGADAWTLTDLNFAANRNRSLWLSGTEAQRASVRSAVAVAFRRGLPVLSCRSLEELGLAGAVRDHLLLRPDELWRRAARHEHCLSPWQTAPVGVDGALTFCDCRPEEPLGNLFERPLAEIWNGERARQLRRGMRGPNPPEECRVCPRF